MYLTLDAGAQKIRIRNIEKSQHVLCETSVVSMIITCFLNLFIFLEKSVTFCIFDIKQRTILKDIKEQ